MTPVSMGGPQRLVLRAAEFCTLVDRHMMVTR